MMQIDVQTFLRLVEQTHRLAFFDIESLGQQGDYGSILVISVKPFGVDPVTFAVRQVGNDQRVVREARDFLSRFDVWCSYYGKGFDVPMLNTRLLRWGLASLDRRLHIDLYYTLKFALSTGRRSQAHLLEWLALPERKMTISADVWASTPFKPKEQLEKLRARCESDTAGLEALYVRTSHLIRDIRP